jgi:hypothetical protein
MLARLVLGLIVFNADTQPVKRFPAQRLVAWDRM